MFVCKSSTERMSYALSFLVITASGGASNASGLVFSDQTVAAGVAMNHAPITPTRYGLMLGGGAIGDFNGDGYQDLYVIGGGGTPDRLYINNGDGTFTDRAADWGIADLHRGNAAAVGDYDGDGDLDLFVTSSGPASGPELPGYNRLYRNNGDNTFTNVAGAAGVATSDPDFGNGLGAAFGDYDLDGDLDLFVSGWYSLPFPGNPTQTLGNRLFRNNGDGTFTDVTLTAGTHCPTTHGFAPTFLDMNGDRYPELLLAGEYRTSKYFLNNGDGSFTDYSIPCGLNPDPSTNAMGMAVGDFNNDGLNDWYITSINRNVLFKNMSSDFYHEMGRDAEVDEGGWGWGAVMIDIDNDSQLDILETNGWIDTGCQGCHLYPNHQSYVWLNNGDETFTDVAIASGLAHYGQGRCLVNFDYDNDGDQDVVIMSYNEPLKLYRNDLSGPGANSLRVFLDTDANPGLAPDGYGARLVATFGAETRNLSIHGGSTYLGVSELSAHFGLGGATSVDELRVEWNNGVVTTLFNVPANQTITVVAGPQGDLNGDGGVDTADLGILIGAFGSAAPVPDINGDGVVDTADLGILIGSFGQ